MRVWVIKTGEPIPYLHEERNDRFLRAGQLVRHLHEQGHEVTWWTGQFDHLSKRQRTSSKTVAEAPEIVLLPSQGYVSHMGLARIRDHRQVARAFRADVLGRLPPDVIVCAYPTPDLAVAAVDYGRKNGVPVVVDVRDLWPDILAERLRDRFPFLPGPVRRIALSPFVHMAHSALGGADGVISLTAGMLAWAQQTGRRAPSKCAQDRVFHQSRSAPVAQPLARTSPVADYLGSRPLARDGEPRIRLVWVGSIIKNTDGITLLRALDQQTSEMRDMLDFAICGRGALADAFVDITKRCENVTYFEWLDDAELTALLAQSHIGLMCYLDRKDFQMSIPNKVVDYLSARMRILTNLRGELAQICTGTDILLHYKTGSERSLLKVLAEIAADPQRYRARLLEAEALFRREFDSAIVQRALESYLERIAGISPSRA